MHKIDPKTEKLYKLEETLGLFSKPPTIRTLWRWVLNGTGRQKHKLSTIKIGDRRYSSEKAVADLIDRCSGFKEEAPESKPNRKQRAQAARCRLASAN